MTVFHGWLVAMRLVNLSANIVIQDNKESHMLRERQFQILLIQIETYCTMLYLWILKYEQVV